MGQRIKTLYEKNIEWGCRDANGAQVSNNGIKVVAYSDHTFIIVVHDFVEGYLKEIASYVGDLDEAVALRDGLDHVIEKLRTEVS